MFASDLVLDLFRHALFENHPIGNAHCNQQDRISISHLPAHDDCGHVPECARRSCAFTGSAPRRDVVRREELYPGTNPTILHGAFMARDVTLRVYKSLQSRRYSTFIQRSWRTSSKRLKDSSLKALHYVVLLETHVIPRHTTER